MAVTAITFGALRNVVERPQHVRKPLQTIVLEANIDAAVPDLATGFIDATDTTKLSIDTTIWRPWGLLASDGVSEKIKTSDEQAEDFNDMESPRKDIVGVERTLDVTLIDDHSKEYLEKAFGVDLSAAVAQANGALAFDSPAVPSMKYKRLLTIAMDFADGDQTKPIFDIDCYVRAQQAELPSNEKKKKGYPDATISYNLYKDSTLGTYCRRWRGGKGYNLPDFGFTAA